MNTRFFQMLLYLLVPTLSGIAAAQEHSLKTVDETSDFMQSYYEEPRPDLIGDLIVALHSSGYLQMIKRVPAVIGFFSEIFAANPDRRSQWQAVIAKQDDQVKAALGRAFAVSTTGGIINLEGHSAELNDEYWGAFFASGNPKFIAKLVDQLRYFDERNDEMLFLAGGTAKWSLSSNALQQPGVRSAIEQARLKADKRTQEIITELLTKDPSSVKQEVIDIVKVQREAGKWR